MRSKVANMHDGRELFLALTSDESFWDTSKEIVFLGEEVCSYTSKYYSPERVVLPEFWEDEKQLNDSIEFTNATYENVLQKLTLSLNEIHGLEKNTLYWRRIIGYFLRTYVDTMYDKYVRLKYTLKAHPHIVVCTLAQESFCTSDNAFHFVQAVRESDTLNLQLFTQILSELDHKTIISKPYSFSIIKDAEKIQRGNQKNFKHFVVEQIQKFMNRGKKSQVSLYVSLFNNRSLLKIVFGTKFKCWPIFSMDSIEQNITMNYDLRNQIFSMNSDNSENEFENIILKTLVNDMPTDFIEGFSNIRNKALMNIEYNVPKAIITGIGFLWETAFSIWAAECAERGSVLYGMQHGGTYGEVEYISVGEVFEQSLTDYYITWGWKKDETTIPMPPSRLIGLEKQNFNKNENILWVTSADSKYVAFIGTIVFGSRYIKYFEHQANLYNNLSPKLKEKISVRLYPDDFGWQLKERWLDRNKDIHFADVSEPLMIQAQKHKLLIIDHFGGTSTLECFRLKIPMIIIGSNKLFTLDPEAKKYYKLLEDAGVLFFDAFQAADSIKSAYGNIDEWWNDSERQKAIGKFVNHFAKPFNRPIDEWVLFINEIGKK